ncbi:RidA family protein [Stackebrandtia soli]|uniref:RidA family protein n=1 Tax=Stackebrandtia soli TaxID=1892856 RepID=UPI0039ECDFF4
MSDDEIPGIEFGGIDETTDAGPDTSDEANDERLITIAAIGPYGDDGRLVGVGDVEAQARQAFANVTSLLAAEGVGLDDIIKLTYYVADEGGLPLVTAIRDAFVDGRVIAGTFAAVTTLSAPDVLVEVDVFAIRKSS